MLHTTMNDQKVLSHIIKFTKENGFSPSCRDLMKAMKYQSPQTITKRLERLKVLGAIKSTKGIPRSIVVLKTSVWS